MLSAAMLACTAGDAAAATHPEIRVLSNRADLISGGDALVEIELPPGAEPASVTVLAGERDVTAAFAERPRWGGGEPGGGEPGGRRLVGLLDGLPLGETVVRVRLPDGSGARLKLANHPASGPVFAGPQTQPWLCDGPCERPAAYSFLYRSTNSARRGFLPYDQANPPEDVARTTTDQGRTVPFVVRVETGTMDRGIYAIAVLFDPGRPWEPWAPQPGWAIGSILGNGNALEGLARGFAVASSGLNKLGSNCNTVVSAEAVMMLKEHIAETYGPIRYTIGAGGSGGAIQQHQIASAYPGLLDGIQPAGSFPDIWQPLQQAEDCHLLNRYFDGAPERLWAPAQQDAVTGYAVAGGCRLQWDGPHGLGTPVIGNYAGTWLDPDNAPGCGLDAAQVYNAETNRGGVRCTLPDYMVSIFGRRPGDGFANRPYDNAGVQYGLRALESGRISPEQFVDLNEKVGGIDIDWNPQPERSVADAPALDVAYRAGLVSNGRELAKVPIVDIRGHDNYEIHSDFNSYVTRARLDRANGQHENQVIFTGARPQVPDPASLRAAFDLVDEWLARIEADRSGATLQDKVRRNRPRDAVDTCWFEGRPVTDPSVCRAAFPYFADPRIAASGPLADDVIKCRLRPLERDEYGVAFTASQWERLKAAFPDGVCDYSRPGVAQRPPAAWTTFAGGQGGRPLGPPPRSVPYGSSRPSQPE